jgi:hypothetical protein
MPFVPLLPFVPLVPLLPFVTVNVLPSVQWMVAVPSWLSAIVHDVSVLAGGAVAARAAGGQRGAERERENETSRLHPVGSGHCFTSCSASWFHAVRRLTRHGRLSLLTSPPRSAVLS